jgi:hypothetical protein
VSLTHYEGVNVFLLWKKLDALCYKVLRYKSGTSIYLGTQFHFQNIHCHKCTRKIHQYWCTLSFGRSCEQIENTHWYLKIYNKHLSLTSNFVKKYLAKYCSADQQVGYVPKQFTVCDSLQQFEFWWRLLRNRKHS